MFRAFALPSLLLKNNTGYTARQVWGFLSIKSIAFRALFNVKAVMWAFFQKMKTVCISV